MEVTTISSDARAKPDLRLLLRHPAHFVALGAGSGLFPRAPGTAGSLLAVPIYWGLAPYCTMAQMLLLVALGFMVGIWACALTGRALGAADHGAMVWDEIVAFLLVLIFTPATWLWQSFAFLLFRLFDILKPPPIRFFDRKWKNGFGVMFDDLLAAGYAVLVLAVTQWGVEHA